MEFYKYARGCVGFFLFFFLCLRAFFRRRKILNNLQVSTGGVSGLGEVRAYVPHRSVPVVFLNTQHLRVNLYNNITIEMYTFRSSHREMLDGKWCFRIRFQYRHWLGRENILRFIRDYYSKIRALRCTLIFLRKSVYR